MRHKTPHAPGSGKQERYLQPSILMALRIKPTYGYELIKEIQNFGFVQGQAPPGMIYRHLRQLEADGLVTSEWETDGGGPAKRIYAISPDGVEVLGLWVDYMSDMAGKLNRFVEIYHRHADAG
jgi:poly-beta-hydroxybutyrate-responsive repressor